MCSSDTRAMAFLPTATAPATTTSRATQRTKTSISRSSGTLTSPPRRTTLKSLTKSSSWINCCATTQGSRRKTCSQTTSTLLGARTRTTWQGTPSTTFPSITPWCLMIIPLRRRMVLIGVLRGAVQMSTMMGSLMSLRVWTSVSRTRTLITRSITAPLGRV